MFRKILVSLALAALALASGCATKSTVPQPDLVSELTSSIGLTPTQAAVGTGSTLQLAQDKLPAGDFDKISKSIPGADKYLAQAKEFLGGGGKISDLGGLNSALGKAGLSQNQIDKFLPKVTDYVGKYGGDAAKKALSSVLK
jgi:hypothetical protein